jgi:hypothetical protein
VGGRATAWAAVCLGERITVWCGGVGGGWAGFIPSAFAEAQRAASQLTQVCYGVSLGLLLVWMRAFGWFAG